MTDLDRLLAALRVEAGEPLAHPPSEPRAGESTAQWLAEVAAIRAAHDRSAIHHRQRLDAACEQLFGTTAHALLELPDAEVFHRDVTVQVPAEAAAEGTAPGVPVRAQVPVHITAPASPTATIVRLHGGAFWMGGGDVSRSVDHTLVDHLALALDAAVLDVDYRLAPEYRYPASMVDALHVLDAVRSGTLGVPRGPIVLVGTSSGGNNAAMLARIEAQRGNPIAALGLVVPSVMLAAGPQSADADPEAWRVRSALLSGYLGDLDPADPLVSPGALDRLDGMPPTFAAIAEFDEVAAGAAELCAAIRAGGGYAETRSYPMTHVVAPPAVEAAYIRDLGEFLRERLS